MLTPGYPAVSRNLRTNGAVNGERVAGIARKVWCLLALAESYPREMRLFYPVSALVNDSKKCIFDRPIPPLVRS